MLRPRIRDAGDAAVVAELPARIDPMTNAAVLRLADRVRAAAIKGVRDIVPAIRSLAVFFDPLHTDVDALKEMLGSRPLEPDIAGEGHRHELPVVYGGDVGADLDEVAAASGVSRQKLIQLHAGRDYRVYMLGFLPGFAYLGTLDPTIVAARRAAPRLKVPAGAVGVAGRQTGVYPRESPGGWGLLGWSPARMFDPMRHSPSLLAPGDTVRFVPVSGGSAAGGSEGRPAARSSTEAGTSEPASPAIEVRRPGLMTTVQDCGRWGHQIDGVSVAGAMDRVAHRMANAIVGNETAAATLEISIGGPELIFVRESVVAVTGADLSPMVNGQVLPHGQAMTVAAGSTLSFGNRHSGARAYLAFAGGIDVPLLLGSRSTHVASGLGGVEGRALKAGDQLRLLPRGPLQAKTVAAVRSRPPAHGGRVRVLPGPQSEGFPADAMARLAGARFTVSPESNRMGYRLTGGTVPSPAGEMISDVTFPGAVQVPPSGNPILLMTDRQTTGGYAQLAVVISADLPIAAQLAPGDWIEFEFTTPAAALAALQEQERALQHLEGHAFA